MVGLAFFQLFSMIMDIYYEKRRRKGNINFQNQRYCVI